MISKPNSRPNTLSFVPRGLQLACLLFLSWYILQKSFQMGVQMLWKS